MTDFTEIMKEMHGYYDEGDLMTALNFLETNVKPIVNDQDVTNPLVQCAVRLVEACDDEDWNTALSIGNEIGDLLNG